MSRTSIAHKLIRILALAIVLYALFCLSIIEEPAAYADDPEGFQFTVTYNSAEQKYQAADQADVYNVENAVLSELLEELAHYVNGMPTKIIFGNGSNYLNSGTDSAIFSAAWSGEVAISGRLTSAVLPPPDLWSVTTTGFGTVTYNGSGTLIVLDAARVENSTTGVAIFCEGVGNVAIMGGTVQNTGSGSAIRLAALNGLSVSGGTVVCQSEHYTIENFSDAALHFSGGQVNNNGTGGAVYNRYLGKVTVSNEAYITSRNAGLPNATLQVQSGVQGEVVLEVTGGIIENRSTGIAVGNVSAGSISISGGTVKNTSTGNAIQLSDGELRLLGGTVSSSSLGEAVHSGSALAKVTLSGAPTVTGNLYTTLGTLYVEDGFVGEGTYNLTFDSYTHGVVAINNGVGSTSRFRIATDRYELRALGADVRLIGRIQINFIAGASVGPFTRKFDEGTVFSVDNLPDPLAYKRTGYRNNGVWYVLEGNDNVAAIGKTAEEGLNGATLFLVWSLAKVTVTTDSLPTGTYGKPYSATVTASIEDNASGTLHYVIARGSLPSWLKLGEFSGMISFTGGVTTAQSAGTYTFTVRATLKETELFGEREFTIVIEKANGDGSINLKNWRVREDANTPTFLGIVEEYGIPTISYKIKDASDDTYTTTIPEDAGEYTVRAVFSETANYKSLTITSDFTVEGLFSPSIIIGIAATIAFIVILVLASIYMPRALKLKRSKSKGEKIDEENQVDVYRIEGMVGGFASHKPEKAKDSLPESEENEKKKADESSFEESEQTEKKDKKAASKKSKKKSKKTAEELEKKDADEAGEANNADAEVVPSQEEQSQAAEETSKTELEHTEQAEEQEVKADTSEQQPEAATVSEQPEVKTADLIEKQQAETSKAGKTEAHIEKNADASSPVEDKKKADKK